MSRRLPLCSICGGSLRASDTPRARVILEYQGLPGRPTIGWHDICLTLGAGETELMRALGRESRPADFDVKELLRQVEARGSGRLVAGRAWEGAR